MALTVILIQKKAVAEGAKTRGARLLVRQPGFEPSN